MFALDLDWRMLGILPVEVVVSDCSCPTPPVPGSRFFAHQTCKAPPKTQSVDALGFFVPPRSSNARPKMGLVGEKLVLSAHPHVFSMKGDPLMLVPSCDGWRNRCNQESLGLLSLTNKRVSSRIVSPPKAALDDFE